MAAQHTLITSPHGHPALRQAQLRRAQSVQLRIADGITKYAGSMAFVYTHIAPRQFATASKGWRRADPSSGYRVPAAQVPDGLAVLPLDGVLEQMG
jgi:hypothetical protein